jgi:hypothetical protein
MRYIIQFTQCFVEFLVDILYLFLMCFNIELIDVDVAIY